MIKIGMLIADRYEILEKIGTGGMSDVYKAKDHKLNRLVAVKVLKQEFSENANFVSKFRVEAQAAAGLMHPNIVNVYDVGEEKGLYYIVMELVDGITLKKYIEKKARLSVKEAISIAIQVSMGLEAAHQNHIIHRDIKPQNIIISKDGKVKVTDFGIAKAATSNTITSNVMGSVHYTSPEQARGGYSDEKSDIYSLGITLFEMLTGRVPFNGETTVAIAIKHIQQPMPSPREFVPEIPESVEQIVLKCCEKSPDRRYQNMSELIADLKQSLIHPDGGFVRRVNPDEESSTRLVTDRERRDIRERYDASADEEDRGPEQARRARYEEEPYGEDDEERPARGTERSRGGAPRTRQGQDRQERQDRQDRSGAERGPRAPRRTSGTSRERDGYGERRVGQDTMRLREMEQARRYDERGGYRSDNGRGGDYNPRMEKVTTILSILAAVVIGLVIIFFAAKKFGLLPGGAPEQSTAQSGTVTMIDVVGQEADAAKAALLDLGLTPEITYEDSDQTPGIVIAASAAKGEQVAAGSNVTLTVSAGANGIEIPDVTGKPLAEARSTLEKKGFAVNAAEAADENVEKGNIISQNPAGGQTAPSGSTITITVSTGPDTAGKVEVPVVTGVPEDEAMAILVSAGLQLGAVTEVPVTDANLRGVVANQSVEAGTMVDPDTKVDIQIGAQNKTYSYTADIAAPTAAEDAAYVPGTSVYIVIITADGQRLLDTTVTNFPVQVSYTGITSATGTLQMSYTDTTQGSVTTDPATGATVETPGTSEQKQLTRLLTFTPEN